MAFSTSRLSALQRDLPDAFSKQTSLFFLTGGAVLAGWLLGHRRTDDLDIFTEDDEAMADADRLVRSARELEARFQRLAMPAGDGS